MKKLIQWVLAGAAFFWFAACTTGNTPSPLQPTRFSAEKTTLVVWLVEQENEVYSRLAEAFERENPSINLSLEEIPADDYPSRVEDAAAASSGPDVALVNNSRWIMEGKFLPLEEAIREYAVPAGDFNQGAVSRDCVYNERFYCLGTATSAYVLLYNKDLLDKIGANYPRQVNPMSIGDYFLLAQRFSPGAGEIQLWGGDIPLPYLWMERETHLSPDGREITRFINDEPTVNTYQRMVDLCASQAAPCSGASGEEAQDGIHLFAQGKLATLITEISTALPVIEESDVRWGAAIVPVEAGGAASWTTAWTDGFGVLANSRHSEEALRFLAFLANRGSALRVEAGQIPLNMKLAQQWAGKSQPRGQVVKILATARAGLYMPDYKGLTATIEPVFWQAVEKGIPAKDMLDETAPQLQEFLDRSWAEYDRLNQPE
jgi:multiple sugar transport system substrate-binding protein